MHVLQSNNGGKEKELIDTNPGNRYMLFAWFTCPTFPFPTDKYIISKAINQSKNAGIHRTLGLKWFLHGKG